MEECEICKNPADFVDLEIESTIYYCNRHLPKNPKKEGWSEKENYKFMEYVRKERIKRNLCIRCGASHLVDVIAEPAICNKCAKKKIY